MEEKRKFMRFPVQVQATCLSGDTGSGCPCTVTQVSREGIAVRLHGNRTVDAGETIHLDLNIPDAPGPEQSEVALKWTAPAGLKDTGLLRGGGKFVRVSPEAKERLLDSGYENWKRSELEKASGRQSGRS